MTIGVNLSQTLNDLIKSRYTNEVSDSIQRLTSGLQINDSADDIGGLTQANRLGNVSSELTQGIENGNSALGLVQVSNKALSSQLDLLDKIKEMLNLSKQESTSSTSKDAIRENVIDLIDKIDSIASSTNYNNIYTLQKSSADNDYSSSTTILLKDTSITTQSIKSNSDGLSLDTLKNLTAGELTSEVSVAQLDVIDEAITAIEDNVHGFSLSQTEIEIAVENLTGIEKTTSESKDKILLTDINRENAVLDKFKLLENSSEFAIVQANLTQERILSLLATPTIEIDYNKESDAQQYTNNDSDNDYDNPIKDSYYTVDTSNNTNSNNISSYSTTSSTPDSNT